MKRAGKQMMSSRSAGVYQAESANDVKQKAAPSSILNDNSARHCSPGERDDELDSQQGEAFQQDSEAGTTNEYNESQLSDENISKDQSSPELMDLVSTTDSRFDGSVMDESNSATSLQLKDPPAPMQFTVDLCDKLRPQLNRVPSKKSDKEHCIRPTRGASANKAQAIEDVQIRYHDRIEQPEILSIFSLSWSGLCSDNSEMSATYPLTVRYVAACAGRHVTMYKLRPSKKPDVTQKKYGSDFDGLILEYCYADVDRTEDFYACEFAGQRRNLTGNDDGDDHITSLDDPLLLCVGGLHSMIKVIDCKSQRVVGTLKGHGASIHDLKLCPVDEWLLLSASIDQSCRLWNLRILESGPIAVFGGHAGHSYYVNSICWHISGQGFVSGGMDNTINVWELSESVAEAIAASHQAADKFDDSNGSAHCFVSSVISQFPIFSTKKVHTNCVDCVQFVGDLILSKSIENNVRLWFPKIEQTKSALGNVIQPASSDVVLLRTFDVENAEYWFVRFALDPAQEILAAGNTDGVVYLFAIGAPTAEPFRKLKTEKVSTIRYLSFSPEGNVLLAATDDGTIYRWNLSK